eukprot:gene7701-15762_t
MKKAQTLFMSTKSNDENSQSENEISITDQKLIDSLQAHQASAPKLPKADEVRTFFEVSTGFGTLSTNSAKFGGYPTGSVVSFAVDESGYPFLVASSLSPHTTDLKNDGRTSLTIMANDFKGLGEGRAVMIGDITKVSEDKIPAYREKFLSKHKDSFWVDFGDMSFFIMSNIKAVRYVGGFGGGTELTGEQYLAAKPDPLCAMATPVMKHMNDDHESDLINMIQHYLGVPTSSAKMLSLDRLGMTVQATLSIAGGMNNKLRVPFLREVTDRKGIKEMLVEMTKASRTADVIFGVSPLSWYLKFLSEEARRNINFCKILVFSLLLRVACSYKL